MAESQPTSAVVLVTEESAQGSVFGGLLTNSDLIYTEQYNLLVIYFAPLEFGCFIGRVSDVRMASVKPHGWVYASLQMKCTNSISPNLRELDIQIFDLRYRFYFEGDREGFLP